MMKKPEHILDEFLVLNAQNGDRKAMTMLVSKWHGVLIKQAYRNVHIMVVAEDIVQDSWHLIIRKINTINDPARFRVWATSIVYNKSIDWIRRQQKQREVIQNQPPELIEDQVDVNKEELVSVALKKLAKQQQLILSMFYSDDYSVSDIAKILKLPAGTVKSRLFNARKKLKETMESKNR